jgi:acetyl/propionyl-CoA carboxylase alpha subunit
MLAKVVAWAPARADTAHRLAGALAGTQIHGVATNRDLLVGVLRHPAFLGGSTDTGFLERHDPVALSTSPGAATARHLHAVAAALAGQAERRAGARVLAHVPSGWRNARSGLQTTRFEDRTGTLGVGYAISGTQAHIELDGESRAFPEVELVDASPDHVELSVDGVRRQVETQHVEGTWYVDSVLGASAFRELPRFPAPDTAQAVGSLIAPMPGTVVRIEARVGEIVAPGAAIVVIEAMKMEHAVRAAHGGTVEEVRVQVGAQVEAGEVLAVVTAPVDDRVPTEERSV